MPTVSLETRLTATREEQCGNCRFWRIEKLDREFPEDLHGHGTCRIGRPQLGSRTDASTGFPTGSWPATADDDWCGEWAGPGGPSVKPRPDWEEFRRSMSNRIRRAFARNGINSWESLLSDVPVRDLAGRLMPIIDPLMWKSFGTASLNELMAGMRAAGVEPPRRWSDGR